MDSDSDYELHHTAVRLAGERNALSELLHKALETQYTVAVRAFQRCRTPESIRALWAQALADGGVSAVLLARARWKLS